MTVDISEQAASLALIAPGAVVVEQAVSLAIFPGTRITVISMSAYLALFDTAEPVGRRRTFVLITG